MLIRSQYCSYNFNHTLTSFIFLLSQLFDKAIVSFLIVDCSALLHIVQSNSFVFLFLKLCNMLILLIYLLFLLLCSLHCIIIEFVGELQLFTLLFPVFKKGKIVVDCIWRLLVFGITVMLHLLFVKFNCLKGPLQCFWLTELVLKLQNTEVLLMELWLQLISLFNDLFVCSIFKEK